MKPSRTTKLYRSPYTILARFARRFRRVGRAGWYPVRNMIDPVIDLFPRGRSQIRNVSRTPDRHETVVNGDARPTIVYYYVRRNRRYSGNRSRAVFIRRRRCRFKKKKNVPLRSGKRARVSQRAYPWLIKTRRFVRLFINNSNKLTTCKGFV